MALSDARDQLQTALGTQYTVEREVGRGGMATVFLARDLKHGRSVALKVLHAELASSLGPERFRREIAIAAQLQHPHILTVLDSGETSGRPALVHDAVRRRRERCATGSSVIGSCPSTRQSALVARPPRRSTTRIATTSFTATSSRRTSCSPATDRRSSPISASAARSIRTVSIRSAIARAFVDRDRDGHRDPDVHESGAGQRRAPSMLAPTSYSLGAVLYEMLAGEPPFTGPTAQSIVAKMMAATSVRSTDAPRRVRRRWMPRFARRWLLSPPTASRRRVISAGRSTPASEPTRSEEPAGTKTNAPLAPSRSAAAIWVGAAAPTRLWRQRETRPSSIGGTSRPRGNRGPSLRHRGRHGEHLLRRWDHWRDPRQALGPSRPPSNRTTSSNEYRHRRSDPTRSGANSACSTCSPEQCNGRGTTGTRRVRVSPELVEVRGGAPPETRWRESFDTTLADVFDVQTAVAARVADKLGVVLSPPAQPQLAKRRTQNLAAYDAYLRSVALTGADHVSLRHALAAAEQAVALDSTFAAAWAHVSDLHARRYTSRRFRRQPTPRCEPRGRAGHCSCPLGTRRI